MVIRVKKKPAAPSRIRIAVFLQLETEHGRGILRGIAQFFRHHPEVTILKFAREERFQVLRIKMLNPDGIIAKVATPDDERTLLSLGIPVVNVSGQSATPGTPTVNSDDELVGRMAARHLMSRGFRTLAFCGDELHLASRLRHRGFEQEAKANGIAKVHAISMSRSAKLPKQAGVLSPWLRALPRPCGVFGFTDQTAIEVAEVCELAQIEVPKQIGILGVGNDLTRLDFSHVEVSSIQLNTQRIGQLAGEFLYRMLQRGKAPAKRQLLPPVKIVTRKSTDIFAVDDDAVAQALDYIRENVGNTIYVTNVAQAAGLSRRNLELRFRRLLNTSVYGEVQRAHFEHAIKLMAEPDLTISEIAYASGFESAQRFSTAFRRRYGKPPVTFRETVRNG